jgi:hypothetical protein
VGRLSTVDDSSVSFAGTGTAVSSANIPRSAGSSKQSFGAPRAAVTVKELGDVMFSGSIL